MKRIATTITNSMNPIGGGSDIPSLENWLDDISVLVDKSILLLNPGFPISKVKGTLPTGYQDHVVMCELKSDFLVYHPRLNIWNDSFAFSSSLI